MSHWLVIQYPDSVAADFDCLIRLEDLLTEAVGDTGTVDGHDIGAGEMNLFVTTPDAPACFAQIQTSIHAKELLQDLRAAAYRDADGETYTILWPDGLTEFSVS